MSEMKMIVGLGNPGDKYENTRHNAGFKVIDALAQRLCVDVKKKKFNARMGECVYKNKKLILLKPWQYMNLSGHAVATAVGFYRIELSDLLLITDDMALDTGVIRIRPKGSSGGQNGLADVIRKLGTQEFARLRIGIGASEVMDAAAYVLGRFTPEQKPLMETAVDQAANAVLSWVERGIDKTMSMYNTRAEEND